MRRVSIVDLRSPEDEVAADNDVPTSFLLHVQGKATGSSECERQQRVKQSQILKMKRNGSSSSSSFETGELCDSCSWKKPHFFKVLMGDFHKRLKIPPAFTKHLTVRDFGAAMLKDRASRCWDIELLKTGSSMVFGNGWKKFVKENDLETGDFLVFQYEGKLHFTVTIFGRSSCEKNLFVGKSPPNPITYLVSHETHGRKRERQFSDENKKEKYRRTKAWDVACSFKTTNPTFKKVVTNSNCYFMHVPEDFSDESLPKRRCLVKLENSVGMQWSVRYIVAAKEPQQQGGTQRVRRALSAGWHTFSNENQLKKDDVCVFEFKRESYVFKVHIFRARGE